MTHRFTSSHIPHHPPSHLIPHPPSHIIPYHQVSNVERGYDNSNTSISHHQTVNPLDDDDVLSAASESPRSGSPRTLTGGFPPATPQTLTPGSNNLLDYSLISWRIMSLNTAKCHTTSEYTTQYFLSKRLLTYPHSTTYCINSLYQHIL